MTITKTAQPSIFDEIPEKNLTDRDDFALIDEVEAARLLACSKALLRKWRAKVEGPSYCRIGKLIRYNKTDIRSLLLSNRVETRLGR